MPFVCVCFLCSQPKSSRVIVVFNFSASLNDVAPVFPMLLPVDLMIIKSKLLMNAVCVLFL